MTYPAMILVTMQRGMLGWLLVALILTLFERFNRREPDSIAARMSGMSFWMISLPLSAILSVGLSAVIAALDIRPLVTLPIFAATRWAGPLATLVAILLGAVFNDFFFYWYHRIQHRWLWRFHAVHHSIRDLNAVNSYHHISETVIGLVLFAVPTSLIVADVGPVLPIASFLIWLHVVWIHSPTRAHLGPLRMFFADNRFHRIHHSLEERHFDKNFGAFTTVWDRLFGTAYFPVRDEWPAVGLAGIDQPDGLRTWLDLPDRYRAATVGGSEQAEPPARRAAT